MDRTCEVCNKTFRTRASLARHKAGADHKNLESHQKATRDGYAMIPGHLSKELRGLLSLADIEVREREEIVPSFRTKAISHYAPLWTIKIMEAMTIAFSSGERPSRLASLFGIVKKDADFRGALVTLILSVQDLQIKESRALLKSFLAEVFCKTCEGTGSLDFASWSFGDRLADPAHITRKQSELCQACKGSGARGER